MSGSDPSDRAALDERLRRHLPGLRGYVGRRADRLVLGKESRSDLVQSVCREVVEHIERFEHGDDGAFRLWLIRTAERKIIDRYRYYTAHRRDVLREREAPDRERTASGPSPSQQAAAAEQAVRLESALARLPEHYREVIRLARLEGLPLADVARRLGRTEDATRNLLFRAIGALSDAFVRLARTR